MRTKFYRIFNTILVNTILLLLTAVFIVPFIYMLVGGFKFQNEIASVNVTLIPRQPTLSNYVRVFQEWPIWRNTFNSFAIALLSTASNVFFCALAGLAFAKFRFPGREKLFGASLLTMMIPLQAILVPLFIIMCKLHWLNTYAALVVPTAVGAFGIFFMRQYIGASVPTDLLDAARIDGCSKFGAFRLVVMPAIKPALITLGLIIFMNAWNDYLWPIIVLNEKRMYTMSIVAGLAGLRAYELNWGEKLAAATLAALPPVIIFFFFRKQFVKAIMAGALKG